MPTAKWKVTKRIIKDNKLDNFSGNDIIKKSKHGFIIYRSFPCLANLLSSSKRSLKG